MDWDARLRLLPEDWPTLVKAAWPNIDDDMIQEVLWVCSPFPVCTPQVVYEALVSSCGQSGGDPTVAINRVYEEIDECLSIALK